MLKWIRNRLVGYEVFFRREERWVLELVTDDEDAAIAEARRALSTGKTPAARVVRQRSMMSGFTTETIVFEEAAAAPAEKPVVVHSPPVPTPVCRTVGEMFEAAGRRTVGLSLREYLARNDLTVTELMHSWSHIRRFQDKAEILTACIHRIASAQATTTGEPVKPRVGALLGLVDEATTLARDFQVERKKLPHYDGSDIVAYDRIIRGLVGDDRYPYVIRAMLSVWLFDIRSLNGKLEAVLHMLRADGVDNRLAAILDGFAADTLIFADVIQELFGARGCLGEFLCLLADLLQGRAPVVEGVSPLLTDLALHFRDDRVPDCVAILTDRLVQELTADRPLDKLNPAREGHQIEVLSKALSLPDGSLFGGEVVRKAMSSRRLRHRQSVLRAQGLHHIADNLRLD
ncbi:MAG: hypothetical protein RLY86_2706 [Pseudomonadota bacterium]